jgi:iron(III) transport system substrate-binding protein
MRTLICLAILGALCGCSRSGTSSGAKATQTRSVVVFTSLDRGYSEPILKTFEEKTGIRVDTVYDAEAAKTTGLISRLLARRNDPECDVLWNNEIVQTEALAQRQVFDAYQSPGAARIPPRYKDADHRWTGFAGRVRLFIYNTKRFAQPPSASLAMCTDPAYRGQGVIALPYYGTTFTHVAVLYHDWGPQRLRAWLQAARENQTAFAPGNGAACDLVATGERSFGLTDTDDAHNAMLEHKPVAVLIPDPSQGAILIPNTVALIHNAPHPAEGRMLIDYLLSREVERRLARMPSAQIPLGTDCEEVRTPWTDLLKQSPPRNLPVAAIARDRTNVIDLLRDLGLGQ